MFQHALLIIKVINSKLINDLQNTLMIINVINNKIIMYVTILNIM